ELDRVQPSCAHVVPVTQNSKTSAIRLARRLSIIIGQSPFWLVIIRRISIYLRLISSFWRTVLNRWLTTDWYTVGMTSGQPQFTPFQTKWG
ncbi:MAG TPA: hypothetical protein VHO69_13585, partial [Phototrophicaceae bacterium]|nr:hypothetical protein [Phototrophicaceae bacterium]